MVISACDGIYIVVHNTNTEVSVLLLQGLDLEPFVVSWVIPCINRRMGSKKVIHTATESLLEYQTAPQMWVIVLPLAEIELSLACQHFITSKVALFYF